MTCTHHAVTLQLDERSQRLRLALHQMRRVARLEEVDDVAEVALLCCGAKLRRLMYHMRSDLTNSYTEKEHAKKHRFTQKIVSVLPLFSCSRPMAYLSAELEHHRGDEARVEASSTGWTHESP